MTNWRETIALVEFEPTTFGFSSLYTLMENEYSSIGGNASYVHTSNYRLITKNWLVLDMTDRNMTAVSEDH